MSLRTADYALASPSSSRPPTPQPRPPPPKSTLTIQPAPSGRPPSRLSRVSLTLNGIGNADADVDEARRAWQDGDFGDVKQALWNMLNKVDELSARIRYLLNEQEELSTSLTVAKSNLTLALSNNDMLEDALSRTPASAQPYGWRRHSAKEGVHGPPPPYAQAQQREAQSAAADLPRRSLDTASSSSSPAEPEADEGSTFWGFRRPASAASSKPHAPLSAAAVLRSDRSHLTSASVPSLGDPSELERLREALKKEKVEMEAVRGQKAAVEAELESLSQALFEEANKMVADERKARAQAELDLQEMHDEREAMRRTLRMVEEENRRLRGAPGVPEPNPQPGQPASLPSNRRDSHPRAPSHNPYAAPDASGSGYASQETTPTQAELPVPPISSSSSDAGAGQDVEDGIRVDRVWLDAISPPPGQFPRPLNLVSGFGSRDPSPGPGTTLSTTSMGVSGGSRPTSRPSSPLRLATHALSSAGGYLSPALHTTGGYLSPALQSMQDGLRKLELPSAGPLGSPRGERGDPFKLVGTGFGQVP